MTRRSLRFHPIKLPCYSRECLWDSSDEKRLKNLFPLDKGDKDKLLITETDCIECKESFGTQHLINNCLRAINAFANNKGGYIVFGVKDKTWELKGIDGAKFKAQDRKKFNQALLAALSCAIDFDMETLEIGTKTIGVLYVAPARAKPVIATSDKGGVNTGHIYYRYQAENRQIGPAELQQIIEGRIRDLSETILTKHLSTILANGKELAKAVKAKVPEATNNTINRVIRDHSLKSNTAYAAYNFRNNKQAETYKSSGKMPKSTPSIYNQAAVNFVAEKAREILGA